MKKLPRRICKEDYQRCEDCDIFGHDESFQRTSIIHLMVEIHMADINRVVTAKT